MSKKDFIKLRITIPNLEEQIAISKILDESEKEINHTKQKISNLKKIKK
jgi:restriction endonuclease S subunit